MFYYKFYGLNLQTDRALPGFSCVKDIGEVDVKIRLIPKHLIQQEQLCWLEELDWTLLPESVPNLHIFFYKAEHNQETYYQVQYLFKEDSIKYIFNSCGDKIWGFWSREELFCDVVSLLVGYILGAVTRLKGFVAFHASAIAVEGKAILLTGDSGAGKSTTAAAFSQSGFPILADDIVVLKLEKDTFWVQPGYPYLRLWPKSVKALNASVEELSSVSSLGNKRYFNLTPDNTFQTQPLPLGAIYILGKRDSQLSKSSVISLSPLEAMVSLIESAYSTHVLTNSLRSEEFKQLGKFVRKVPVRKLKRPDNLDHLPQLCHLILEDCQCQLLA